MLICWLNCIQLNSCLVLLCRNEKFTGRKAQRSVFLDKRVDYTIVSTYFLRCYQYAIFTVISEDIQMEDMENSEGSGNQWLMRTPRKSFFVSADTCEEKRAWMEHIEDCRSKLLQGGSISRPTSALAVTWIPDQAAFKCMRCLKKFTTTKRRHHCRQCGFLVCNACSKKRAVLGHIHPTKQLRVCSLCHTRNKEDELSRLRGDSAGKNSSEEDYEAASSDEEEGEEMMQKNGDSSWLNSRMGTWGHTGTYVYPRPMNQRPQSEPALGMGIISGC